MEKIKDKTRPITMSDELYQMARNDAKEAGMTFASYVRHLLIKANKEKK